MQETMTVYKALCELKTLKKRIEEKIELFRPVDVYNKATKKIRGKAVKDYEQEVREQEQSISDLIRRRAAIKNAVIVSNGTTKVSINGQEMTVAEAIEYKTHGEYFLELLAQKYGAMSMQADRLIKNSEETASSKVETFLTELFGKKEARVDTAEVEKARQNYIEMNVYGRSDPLDAAKKYEELQNQMDAFNSEFDAAISVSNAVTTITINY